MNPLFQNIRGLFMKPAEKSDALSSPAVPSPDSRQTNETYQRWGGRVCSTVNGSEQALVPFLYKVHHELYDNQARNKAFQEEHQKKIQSEIEIARHKIAGLSEEREEKKQEMGKKEAAINVLRSERSQIKSAKAIVNKQQRLTLVIGLSILLMMTFYLFLFYSSTFYSAFFQTTNSIVQNSGSDTGVQDLMFNGQAISLAAQDGLLELAFILTAPIIFLGLGFCLHQFSLQKDWQKYLKMGSLVLVTVAFDCLLAFKIGDQMYRILQWSGRAPMEVPYTPSHAVGDPNFWAVIFCGFIVYIIWGIVFDVCMTAYDKLDLNKTRLQDIKAEILSLEAAIQTLKDEIRAKKGEIQKMEDEVAKLMARLVNTIHIDTSVIRKEMNNFLAGWIQMMAMLGMSAQQQQSAQASANQVITALIQNKNTQS